MLGCCIYADLVIVITLDRIGAVVFFEVPHANSLPPVVVSVVPDLQADKDEREITGDTQCRSLAAN